jgi:hypothetical protein
MCLNRIDCALHMAMSITLLKLRINFTKNVYNGPTNAHVSFKTLIQMSQTETFKIPPTCFDCQKIIIRELFDPV